MVPVQKSRIPILIAWAGAAQLNAPRLATHPHVPCYRWCGLPVRTVRRIEQTPNPTTPIGSNTSAQGGISRHTGLFTEPSTQEGCIPYSLTAALANLGLKPLITSSVEASTAASIARHVTSVLFLAQYASTPNRFLISPSFPVESNSNASCVQSTLAHSAQVCSLRIASAMRRPVMLMSCIAAGVLLSQQGSLKGGCRISQSIKRLRPTRKNEHQPLHSYKRLHLPSTSAARGKMTQGMDRIFVLLKLLWQGTHTMQILHLSAELSVKFNLCPAIANRPSCFQHAFMDHRGCGLSMGLIGLRASPPHQAFTHSAWSPAKLAIEALAADLCRHTCMHVRTYVRRFVGAYVRTVVCTNVCIYVPVHTHICTCTFTCIHVFMFVRIFILVYLLCLYQFGV